MFLLEWGPILATGASENLTLYKNGVPIHEGMELMALMRCHERLGRHFYGPTFEVV